MKRTGLVVDDDDSTRFVLSSALKSMGFTVMTAEDGAEVPDLVAAHHFDILVMDLYMPGMNGFEVLRRLRRSAPGLLPERRTSSAVPVLVVSGESNAASIANATALGADDYLIKPVDVDAFEHSVRKLLDPDRESQATAPTRPRKRSGT